MRVLVDCHLFDSAFEGTRTYIEGLYSEIFRIEESSPSGRIYYLAARNVQVLKEIFPERPFIRYIPLQSKRSYQRLLFEFPELIRKYQIDYAHFQYIVPFTRRCRYIVTIHDLLFLETPQYFSWYYRAARKWLFKRSYQNAEVVFTVSDFSRDSIRKFYGDGKVVNVVSLTLQQRAISFKSAWTADEWKKKNGLRSYLLYISRFEERKNHYALLKVFYERKLYEEYDLVLVGRRSEECRKFDDLYATLPGEVRKHVVLKTKGVQLEELLEFLVHAKLFVYPSLAEGFGVPPLEAAALAVPVVCSNTTAMKDFGFFGDGHVDCSNEDILFRAIESKMLQPGVDQQQQCELIRDTVLARYSGKNGAIDFLQVAFPESGVSGIKVKSKSERIQQ